MSAKAPRFCIECAAVLRPGLKCCEYCGTPVKAARPQETGASKPRSTIGDSDGSGRAKRVMLALGIVAAIALVLGVWIVSTWTPGMPVVEPEAPTSEELFPVEPVGVDSINNTIDGKKVAIDGDGHIMISPGLGVDRPVWCLFGPGESVFTAPVGKPKGKDTFSLRFQVLVPVLREEVENPKEVSIRLSLIDISGVEQVSEYHLKGENLWQQLGAKFAYESQKAPYLLRFDAKGFEGPIYIDHSFGLVGE